MDKDQVAQRCYRNPDRQRQGHDGDQSVGHQIADDRQQAEQEGQHDQGLGQRQLDPAQRQDHREEHRSERGVERRDLGVERRDLDLRKDDIAKRLHQQPQAIEQGGRQGLALADIRDMLQGDDRPEHHADQQGDEHVRRVLADQLQLAQVLAQPLADRHLEFRRAGRQIGIDERRQLPTGLVHDLHELAQRSSGVLCLMQQETDGAGKDRKSVVDALPI